jgi:hypothetical protein
MSGPRVVLAWDPYTDPYEDAVKFRLTYEGRLLSSSNSNPHAAHKHAVRMSFNHQLRRLWERHAELAELASKRFDNYEIAVGGRYGNSGQVIGKTWRELIPEKHEAYGHRWLPLVLEDLALTCSVEILFLRYGARGEVFNVGDIDGRLKTLFDALAIPRSGSGVDPAESEEPTYVLLQDDRLISHVAVEADELLAPTGDVPIKEDARVVITVNVRMTRPNWRTLSFAGD